MKKFIRILCAVMAVAMMATMFAGCGEKEETKDEQASKQTTTKVLDIKDVNYKQVTKGKLTMATNAYFEPYEFYENNEIVGIDAEIAAAIAEKLGLELEIKDMEFDSIITAVNEGGADIGVAGMTVTEERKESVDFSSSYATGIQSIIVTEDSAIKTVDDLEGKKIGVQLGTTGDIYASDDYGKENVVQYDKGTEAIVALKGGDVDCVIIDNEPAKAYVAATEGLKILETEYAVEEYAIAVAKDNPELLKKINIALEELIADGTVDTIVAKYIKAE